MVLADQLATLLAVIVGAITSFTVTTLSDRSRFRREQARHWTDKKLEVYGAYLNAIKHMNQLSRRIAASRGIGDGRALKLGREKAHALLDDAENSRATASEMVALVGDATVVGAVRDLNREVWRLEWIARGLLQPNNEMWEACNQAYVRALNALHEGIRQELKIPGVFLPRSLERHPRPILPTADLPPSLDHS
ncbi:MULTISPECIES: hypothetical protein [unclassified Nonomuraea]|uniref:hypothetical protein n=1 Tax=unclassified Nonomuraea TaxID=2593643 RepID=UPI0033F12D88